MKKISIQEFLNNFIEKEKADLEQYNNIVRFKIDAKNLESNIRIANNTAFKIAVLKEFQAELRAAQEKGQVKN